MSGPPLDVEPGSAQGRTDLAWTRTCVTFAAVSAGVLRIDPPAGLPLVVVTAAVWAVGTCRSVPHGRPRALGFIALTVLLTALVALGVALSAAGAPHRPGVGHPSSTGHPSSAATGSGPTAGGGIG
ncbi:DUF202 domain-containing protein [Kitasatospora mediocidica]|uniref:DUF202 domain-containing protein n=1 Tax=Kitasatospora mediocidica TaxID=58352 RepID=UPI000562FE31|nr:DUF202 domain-containing protein [Kitasatospora mediocidica]